MEKIQFCIAGSVKSAEGFRVIASDGYFPNEAVTAMDTWTLGESQAFRILHDKDGFVVFSLRENRILPVDDARWVSYTFTIRINGTAILKVSPYDALMDMYNKFLEKYMTLTTEGRYIPKTKTILNNAEEVVQFINNDVLSKYNNLFSDKKREALQPMLSTIDGETGTMSIPRNELETKLSILFRNTRISAFDKFSNIEIGVLCPTSKGLEHVVESIREITRYRVYVKGDDEDEFYETKEELEDFADNYSAYKQSVNGVEYSNIDFTLGKLIENGGKIQSKDGSIVEIKGETIEVTLKSKPIEYTVVVKWSGMKPNEFYIDNNLIKSREVEKYQISNVKLPARIFNTDDWEDYIGFDPNTTSVYKIVKMTKEIDVKNKLVTITVSGQRKNDVNSNTNRNNPNNQKQPESLNKPTSIDGVNGGEGNKDITPGLINKNDEKIKKEQATIKFEKIVYGLVGVLAGLLIGIAICMSLSSDNVVDARQQLLKYAELQNSSKTASELAEKGNEMRLLPLDTLINKLKGKDHDAAFIYFHPEKNESLDLAKVSSYKKDRYIFDAWKPFCDASDHILQLKLEQPNTGGNNNSQNKEEESKESVYTLLERGNRNLADYKKCKEWEGLGSDIQKKLTYLIQQKVNGYVFNKYYNGSTTVAITAPAHISTRVQQIASVKMANTIQRNVFDPTFKFINYGQISETKLKWINDKIKEKYPEDIQYTPDAMKIVDYLFPVNGFRDHADQGIIDGKLKQIKSWDWYNIQQAIR